MWFYAYETKGCPFCSRRRYHDSLESFADLRPDLMEEYSPSNTIDPHRVFPSNCTEVEWICRNDSTHVWRASFNERHFNNTRCPICYTAKTKKIFPGVNSFADFYPDLLRFWSPNNERSPFAVRFDLHDSMLWICPRCKGEYSKLVSDFAVNPDDCPYCNDRSALPGFNSLAVKHPLIAAMWAPGNVKDADHVLPSSSIKAKWICPECSGLYYASPRDITTGEVTCPYCNDRKPLPGFNTLAAKYPDSAAMWAFDNFTDADHVLPSSTLRFKWKCPTCSGLYYASPRDVTAGEVTCPYCSDRKPLAGYNTLAVRYPTILGDWDYTNNYVLADPDHILPTSSVKVWWTCHNDPSHHYPQKVLDKVLFYKRYQESCIYCKGRRRKKHHFV